MDLVDFTEPVLQAMRDQSIKRSGEDQIHVVITSDTHEVSRGDHVRAGFGRLPNNPALGGRDMFFVQGAHHPRT